MAKSNDDEAYRKDNAGLLVHLEFESTQFLFGNSHFWHTPELDFVKHAQAVHYLSTASTFAKENSIEKVILCGDLNSYPHSQAIGTLTS